jgi:Holliday junction resolvasome RuvABC endonuclease subunit
MFDVVDVASEYFGVAKGSGSIQIVWLHGIVNLALIEAGFPAPLYIAPMVLKKLMTGDGRAEKPAMRGAVADVCGEAFDDDNIVDAFAVAHWLGRWHAWRAGEYMGSAYAEEAVSKWKRAIGTF